ncbi:unnamed protein product [Caenorhabditis sp. 36 PRJEB53466]|nr:unnamed protein product [Caenorhabditis sp. 36 PRJEB53466]
MSNITTTSANTYRVGDFVYFDDPVATDAPFQIRKIDELLKSANGVEARCVVYLRRRDIPQHLLKIADQAQRRFDNYYEVDKKKPENFTSKGFVVANGGGAVKEEEAEAEGDDGPPKIDAEEGDGVPVNEERTSSSEAPEEMDTAAESKEENPKEKAEVEATQVIDWGEGGLPLGAEKLTAEERLRLRQHEIFMTRQSEILTASLIRGKCRVVLLGDCEDADIYLPHDDTFYHSLVYDPTAQTLLADKGAIRVGEKYQAFVEDYMEPAQREEKERLEKEAKKAAALAKKEEEAAKLKLKKEEEEQANDKEEAENGKEEVATEEETKKEVKTEPMEVVEVVEPKEESDEREVLVWQPDSGLSERDIDQYLIVARSVGLFARAIDGASVPKLPTLQLAAAFASRDVTILHAYAILHQANYNVGQAIKYLVPVASVDAYPCRVDIATGMQTKSLGGPVLCRDQLEEWSTPEMNLFEDGLDKCGKDFGEIRSDYLPWKSIRDIVEYYYLMKASNRYTDRKKNKTTNGGTEDAKLHQVYIPTYNKAIPANIGTYNTTQNLVRSEIGCENCGTMDAINWYQWGGVEKKVLCSGCWTKWKKFAGLDKKHELERFDKTRPPVLDQQTSAIQSSNGNDRPPVLQVQQQKPATPTGFNQQKPGQTLPRQESYTKQNVLAMARVALTEGRITQEQYNQIIRNFQQQQQQPAAAAQPAAPSVPQKRKPTPATKPPIVFYTTICRRAVRRLLPKAAFNLRKLSRKPHSNIDDEAILKSMIVMDKKNLLNSAFAAAGEKRNLIVEADFHKGITHLQHTLSHATTGKRSAAQNVHAGEPSAKIPRLSVPSYPSGSSGTLVPPTLEDVGNTLLAVNEAMKAARSFVNPPPSQPTLRFHPHPQQLLQQDSPPHQFLAPLLRFPQMQSSSASSLSQLTNIRVQQLRQSSQQPRQAQVPVEVEPERLGTVMEILKAHTDSRWFVYKDDVIKYRAGAQMK